MQDSFPRFPTVGTATGGSGSSKKDHGSSLAGNQHVTPGLLSPVVIGRSPAGGAPLHVDNFTAGHKWTEADGKLHTGTGPSNLPW